MNPTGNEEMLLTYLMLPPQLLCFMLFKIISVLPFAIYGRSVLHCEVSPLSISAGMDREVALSLLKISHSAQEEQPSVTVQI